MKRHVKGDGNVLWKTEHAVDVGLAVAVVTVVEERDGGNCQNAKRHYDATKPDGRSKRRLGRTLALPVTSHAHVDDVREEEYADGGL